MIVLDADSIIARSGISGSFRWTTWSLGQSEESPSVDSSSVPFNTGLVVGGNTFTLLIAKRLLWVSFW